jgi:hypothetical protein
LAPSEPSMTHLMATEVTVHEGELLFFLPDHIHSTRCEPDAATGAATDCLSIHGYISLDYTDNCYLQKLLDMGFELCRVCLLKKYVFHLFYFYF